jgi:hypothetical protein
MQEAKVHWLAALLPMFEARLKKTKGSQYVRLDKGLRPQDGAIHMRLGGKVYYAVEGFLGKESSQEISVLNISMDETNLKDCRRRSNHQY